ncbi:MAG: hypothetical protein ACR2ND_14970 [Solirubrobacteraceae bacterium]
MRDKQQLPTELRSIEQRLRDTRPSPAQQTLDQIELRAIGTRRTRKFTGAHRSLMLALTAGTVLASGGVAVGLTGLFVSGPSSILLGQGINSAQGGSLILGLGGTSIINGSSFTPSINQGATNVNVNAGAPAPTSTGDTFLLGSTSSTVNQAINNSQTATIGGPGSGSGGVLIINKSTYAPSINQGACNVNINGGSFTGGAAGATYGVCPF